MKAINLNKHCSCTSDFGDNSMPHCCGWYKSCLFEHNSTLAAAIKTLLNFNARSESEIDIELSNVANS